MVLGLVSISAATSFGDEFAQVVGIDLAAGVGLDILHFVSGENHRRGIGAVRGIGNQNFLARVALAFEIRANHQQAGEFTLRAGGGLQGDLRPCR
jgi:hypothetical protein